MVTFVRTRVVTSHYIMKGFNFFQRLEIYNLLYGTAVVGIVCSIPIDVYERNTQSCGKYCVSNKCNGYESDVRLTYVVRFFCDNDQSRVGTFLVEKDP